MKHVRTSLVVLALLSTVACNTDALAPEALSDGQKSAEHQIDRPAGPLFSGSWVGSGDSDSTTTDSTSTDSTSVSP